MAEKWYGQHSEIERQFLAYLNRNSNNFILKGGTALYLCYGLDRFSVDIDLDGKAYGEKKSLEIAPYIKEFCAKNNFDANLKKDTDLVERWMIDYGSEKHKLKVEVSYRNLNNEDEYNTINGIKVYKVEDLALMKTNAISERTKIRDFYDVCFIVNKYWDELDKTVKKSIRNTFTYKNFDYVQYLVETQQDELVQSKNLINSFLDAYDKAGLEKTSEEEKTFQKEPEQTYMDVLHQKYPDMSDYQATCLFFLREVNGEDYYSKTQMQADGINPNDHDFQVEENISVLKRNIGMLSDFSFSKEHITDVDPTGENLKDFFKKLEKSLNKKVKLSESNGEYSISFQKIHSLCL